MASNRLQNILGMVGALQGLQGQQTEQDIAQQRLMQMQDEQENAPLNRQLLEQKLQEMMYQNGPEQRQMQTDMGKAQLARLNDAPFGTAIQASSYMPDILQALLKQRGLLPAGFGQPAPNPNDEALRANLAAMMQQKGINFQ